MDHSTQFLERRQTKKKGEGYAFCKFTFSGLSCFNQMKKTLFKKEIVWLNKIFKSIYYIGNVWVLGKQLATERASPGFSPVLVNHFNQRDGNG